MPVSPTPPDDYYFEIARAYQQAELEILGQIKNRLLKGESLDDLDWQTARLAEIQQVRKQAVSTLAKVNQSMTSKINGAFGAAYKDGEWAALKDAQAYLPEKPTAVSSAARQASVRAAANAIHGGLADTMPKLLRTMEDDYARVVNSTVLRVQAGSGDRRSATAKALQEAFGKGLKTGPGGKMNLPDYITMAMRTGVANTSIQGHLDSLGANGLDLVYIQPGPRHCERCDVWSNKPLWRGSGPTGQQYVPSMTEDKPYRVMVWGTLDQAKADGWGHPNCRCSVGAFLPGATVLPKPRPAWDKEGYEAQQAQRVMERKIREWKVKQALSTDPKEVAQAGAKVAEWQKTLRGHLDEHPYLKRQYGRESINGTLGPGKPYDGPVGSPKAPKPPSTQPKPATTPPKPTPPAPKAPSPTSAHHPSTPAPKGSWKGQEKPTAPSEPTMPKTQGEIAREEWLAKVKARYSEFSGGKKLENSNNWSQFQKIMDAKGPDYQYSEILNHLTSQKYLDNDLFMEGVNSLKNLGKLTAAQTKAYKTAMAKYGDELAQYKLDLAQWRTDNGVTSEARGFAGAVRHTNRQGVQWAHENLNSPTKGSPAGNALQFYSGSAYGPWNEALRTLARDGAPLKGGTYGNRTATIDAAMKPIPEDVVLHRGTTWEEFNEGKLMPPPSPTDMVGKTYTNHAYASSSVGESAAFDGKPVQIEIMAPKGTRAVNVMQASRYGEREREVLLARGTRYFVHSVMQGGNKWRVKVEVVLEGEDSSVWTPIP